MDSFEALGQIISADGSSWPDVRDLKRKLWKGFFANCCKRAIKGAPVKTRLKALDVAVTSSFRARCSRWPYSNGVATSIDALQRRMVAMLAGLERRPEEEAEAYCRRRGVHARKLCREHGRWSELWQQRVMDWHRHVRRGHNARCPATALYEFRDRAWLAQRRLAQGSQSSSAGRLNSRRCTHVNVRFEDGVQDCFEMQHARTVLLQEVAGS